MTEEQKQKARDNYKKYYQKNKERILKYQKTYRKQKLATDPEYKEKYNKRWEHFKESFNEQHPDYHKEYNRQWGKNKRNSYKTRCEKAIEYIENHFLYHYGSEKRPVVFEDNYIQEIVDILRGEDND